MRKKDEYVTLMSEEILIKVPVYPKESSTHVTSVDSYSDTTLTMLNI